MGDANRSGQSAPCKGCGKPIHRDTPTAAIRHYCGPECRPRCCIADCDRPARSKGLCVAHAERLRTKGDPLAPKVRGRNEGTCSVDGCEEPMRKRGWCNKHYTHWYLHGDVDAPWAYRHGDGGYGAVHRWLGKVLGPAKAHDCVDCGGRAREWSYVGGDPGEQVDDEGRRFTRNPTAYEPRCIRCHRIFDDNPIATRSVQ